MTSLIDLYNSRRSLANFTFSEVNNIIDSYAASKGYFTVGRIKDLESLLDKLQSGRYSSFKQIDDLVAFSIIIDTRTQENETISFLKRVFDLHIQRQNTAVPNEDVFRFDCTRMYMYLRQPGIERRNQMIFEIQIRTLLQHAWSKITHSEVYKSNRLSSRKARLAAETMAHIESLDRTLATFGTTSRSVKRIPRSSLENLNLICAAFDALFQEGHIQTEFKPRNNKRLAENIVGLLEKRDSEAIKKAAAIIRDYVVRNKGALPTSISLYEIAVIAFEEDKLPIKKNIRAYLSDETLSFYPHLTRFRQRVDLDSEN